MRHRSVWVFIFAVIAVGLPAVGIDAAEDLRTKNIILVSADGLRIQELFEGFDPILLDNKEKSGIEQEDAIRAKFWRERPSERREALMPFFWGTLAEQGIVLGNQKLGSVVKVKNPHQFSYPGYAEILTGMPRPEIDSNDMVQNPVPTVLDFLQEKLNLTGRQVAVFASWNVFNAIATHRHDSFLINAGYEPLPDDLLTDDMKALNAAQFDMLTPWDTVRHDVVTCDLALMYLQVYKPRVLYIAPGETDDWGHERRYDRVLAMAHYFDAFLNRLWQAVQSMEEYKDQTTILITTDHGRGVTPDDWMHHNPKYPGSDDTWIAIVGPDTPNRGELRDTPLYHQANIAATLIQLMGLEPDDYHPEIFPAIQEAFAR